MGRSVRMGSQTRPGSDPARVPVVGGLQRGRLKEAPLQARMRFRRIPRLRIRFQHMGTSPDRPLHSAIIARALQIL